MSLPSGQAPASGQAVITDLELINRIKNDHDSAATLSLVHAHTGIYMSVIRQYEGYSDFRARANVKDLQEDKFINIYNWALKYDPNRPTESGKPMQFGSYVGEMTKYLCKSVISRGSESVELNEDTAPTNDTEVMDTVEKDSIVDTVLAEVSQSDSKKFRRIFKLRYGNPPMSWREISRKVGMTHEGARKHFNKYMNLIKEHARS